MSGRKNHGNNSKRFDVNSFYAYVKKAHINELLDADGNTPFDSDSIDKSVWEYAAYLYKDIQDYGGLLSYFDSDTFRADSDGSGNNSWSVISRTNAISQVYKPLRRWLYSLDSEEGINNTMDLITNGFNRRYYTLPLSDSEGTLRHVNIYTFLKSHFDRWLRFDPYERYKIASRVLDNLNEDSDIRYRFAEQVIIALEEDSDLSRRVTELVSNVLQTDSEVRNEILKTTVKGFQNDSDAARDLAKIIGNVLETDSDIRNEYTDSILVSIKQDSDQQVELGRILSSHEFTELNSQKIYARQVLPMDSDDTGNIGDSDTRWALGNFTTIRSDDLKVRSLEKERIVFISDSEGKLSTSDKLQWQNDSELVVDGNVEVTGVTKSPTVQVTTLSKDRIVYISDSEGTLATSDKLQWQGDSELYVDGDVVVTGQINIPAIKITSLEKDRIVYVADSEGTLATNSKLQWHKDSELLIDGSLQINGRVDTASTTVRELGDVPGGIVFRNANTGKLDVDSRLKYNDSEGLVYDGKSILPIDSETLLSLLIENIDSEFSQYVGLDSDSVEAIISQSTVLSTVAVPTGPKGNIYYIDSDNTNKLVNDNIVKIHTGFYNTGAEITAAISRKTPSQYPHLSDNDSDGNRYSVYDLRINPTLNTSGAPSYRTHWQYDSDRNHNPLYPYSGSWGIDSETTINGKFGVGRLLHNPNTKKTWYNDGSTIHEIGTARTFSDVIVMENLTAPPDSDALGFEGLRPGSIAVADGVTWDPAGYGGLTPYPVFWDGGQWLIFTLF
jgi:hypothetical protein